MAADASGAARLARAMSTGRIALLLTAAAILGLRLYLDRAAENRLRPGEEVAIGQLRGVLPPNAYLACPPGYCAVAGAVPSPVFARGADELYRDWTLVVAREPRVTVLSAEPSRRRITLIQRSAVLRFPDIVTAEIVALGAERSSLAVYSRARYGRYDFGVNRRRVELWLSRLPAPARS